MTLLASTKERTNLIDSVLDNSTRFWTALEVEMHFSNEKTHYISGIPHPLFNGVLRTQLQMNIVSKRIEEAIAQFQRRGLPFSWWVCEKSRPQNLVHHLENHGFVFSGSFPALVWNDEGEPQQLERPDNLSIIPVSDMEMMRQWAEVFSQVFDLPKEIASDYSALFVRGTPKPFRHFIAFIDDEPVATATLFFQPRLASIYNIAVVPKFRHQGVAAALAHHLICHARRVHCSSVMLQAASNHIERFMMMGFRRVCDFQIYYHD
ncbi:MAG: GNAT family N-acetyltransferase [Chlamydiales bacterium]|nr:GNAT family N-acetyltransferase [Chlamydiia bacterium]MCP5507556.1 GNAT family N-acetyltransferase [Chlamydiales bacterium]